MLIDEVFPKPLKGEYVNKGMWKLLEPFEYNNPPFKIVIPKGFVSDGASIPKVFWSIIGSPWSGRYARAALPHDYLYYTQAISRKKADLEFYRAMKVLRVSFVKRWTMYHAVRTFAWMTWKNHKKRLEAENDN